MSPLTSEPSWRGERVAFNRAEHDTMLYPLTLTRRSPQAYIWRRTGPVPNLSGQQDWIPGSTGNELSDRPLLSLIYCSVLSVNSTFRRQCDIFQGCASQNAAIDLKIWFQSASEASSRVLVLSLHAVDIPSL